MGFWEKGKLFFKINRNGCALKDESIDIKVETNEKDITETEKELKTQTGWSGTQTINVTSLWMVRETNNIFNGAYITVNGNEIRCQTLNPTLSHNHTFFVESGSTLVINNANINVSGWMDDHEVVRSRCGVTNNGGTIKMYNCSVNGCRRNGNVNENGYMEMNNSTVDSCEHGVMNSSKLNMTNCTITRCNPYWRSEGIGFIQYDGLSSIVGSTFLSNQNGIFNKNGTTTLTGTDIYSNQTGILNNGSLSLYNENYDICTHINANNIGIENNGNVKHFNGYIHHNELDGVWNKGTYAIAEGNFDNNKRNGILNDVNALFEVNGGNIVNGKYSIE